MKELRRRLYKRGSSFETTIPMPLLFALDSSKKYDVLFRFDMKENKWFIEFEERKSEKDGKKGSLRKNQKDKEKGIRTENNKK